MTDLKSTPSRAAATPPQPPGSSSGRYSIRRRGSRYNIFGPHGRLFRTYQSASVAGPRWEELTGTPWPFRSSAYQPGWRLWQPGAREREETGAETVQDVSGAGETSPECRSALPESADRPSVAVRTGVACQTVVELPRLPLALPAPRFDLAQQKRLIRAVRQNPKLLFDPEVRQALQREVDYHLPQARWANRLLRLLARYEARQRQQRTRRISAETILARHIAWQEHQLSARKASGQAGLADPALAR